MLSPRARAHLDLLRGGAAFVVLVAHVRAIFIETPKNPGLGLRVVLRAAGAGHEAVVAFFVLSGFLVTASTLARPSWRRYGAARAARILTVYWPALALGALIDHLGRRTFGGIYRGEHPVWWFDGRAFGEWFTPGVAAKNAVFLQWIRGPVLGSNIPLWTLSHEVWFYVAFPLVWIAFTSPARTHRALSLVALAGVGWIVGRYAVATFALWLIGSALAARLSGARRESTLLMLLAAACSGFVLNDPSFRRGLLRDVLVAVLVAALVAFAVRRQGEVGRLYARVSGALASVSFSLYLVHMPALVFLAATRGVPPRWPLAEAARTLPLVAIVLLYAIAFWFLVERRTATVRRWLSP